MFSQEFQSWAQAGWQARAGLWEKAPAWPEALAQLNGQEQTAFQALGATLPATDVGDYSPQRLIPFLREGLAAREDFGWCRALPERMFWKDVLYPRVNNEELSPCRELFRRELEPRLTGLDLPEAILEVNRWCAGHVTYRSTDERTASALAVYHRGWGRCGEESLFAVNALRSVGIAARQIYAPRWSHCDDNHAWVEAWDGARWRFLGACEPEPRLDMGWFPPAAGRAMLIHTRAFAGAADGHWLFPETDPLDLDMREGLAYESVTGRYAPTGAFQVQVTGPNGPAAGARVGFYLLNEGALWPIAQRLTDKAGQTALNLGRGSLWVLAQQEGRAAEALVHTGEQNTLELVLGQSPVGEKPVSFCFTAPPDRGSIGTPLTPAEREAKGQVLARARACRKARGSLVGEAPGPEWADVLRVLTKKDRAQKVDPAVLEDCRSARELAGLWPEEVFQEGLLSPRFGTEPLAPWRAQLAGAADQSPEDLWPWLQEHVERLDSFQDLPQTPAGAWALQGANAKGMAALYCALCRAEGVPARLGAGGWPEYWRAGAFHPAAGQAYGWLSLSGKPGGVQKLGLMRLDEGWTPLPAPQPGQAMPLPPGRYRLICSTRLPNGNQLARAQDFTLASGQRLALLAEFRQARAEELVHRLALPQAALEREGQSLSLWELLGRSPYTLLCWLDPGAEPTEHLLGEVEAASARLAALGCQTLFVGDGPGWWRCEAGLPEAVARRFYLEPGVLPLLVLAERQGDGLYACAGYNVGSVELAAGIAQALGG